MKAGVATQNTRLAANHHTSLGIKYIKSCHNVEQPLFGNNDIFRKKTLNYKVVEDSVYTEVAVRLFQYNSL